MSTRLYVGSLPYSTTDHELVELFSQHGTVQSAQVVTDKFTGRSRGFGFVEMSSADDARRAIGSLNGMRYGERTLVVNEARPMERRERSASRW